MRSTCGATRSAAARTSAMSIRFPTWPTLALGAPRGTRRGDRDLVVDHAPVEPVGACRGAGRGGPARCGGWATLERSGTISGAPSRAASAVSSSGCCWESRSASTRCAVVLDLALDAGPRPSRARRPSARRPRGARRRPRSKVSIEIRVRRVSTSSRCRAPSCEAA